MRPIIFRWKGSLLGKQHMGKGPFFGRCSKAGPARHLWRYVLGIVRSLICPEKRAGHAPALQGQRGCIVGAHLCVRPCTNAACTQRADTWVGPYRGSKVVWCFGGVAIVGFVQRSRQASTLQRCRIERLPCRGAPVCAPVHESDMLQRADTWVGPYRGSKVVWCFGGVAIVRFVQRAGHAPPLHRYQTIPAHKKGASPGAPTCLL